MFTFPWSTWLTCFKTRFSLPQRCRQGLFPWSTWLTRLKTALSFIFRPTSEPFRLVETTYLPSAVKNLERNGSPEPALMPNSWLSSRPPLSLLAQQESTLPLFVRESAVALKYLRLLGSINWERFPDRPDQRFYPDCPPLSYTAFAAAYLVKIDQHMLYISTLREYLIEHPPLAWVLGFPLIPSTAFSWGFDVEASLPTHRHLSHLLRFLPNTALQFLLDETVRLIQAELREENIVLGECVSLDTKHIVAWVKENNPKAYVTDRYDKTKQPTGDPDCRLGCKRRHNQATSREAPPTPTHDGVPANTLSVGEFYWGYASGVIATKVPDWGEFVLAELTQPFDQSDVSYFFPLLADTERRLGYRPKFAAFDAAFDAFYVYERFHQEGQSWEAGFAAVPFSERGGYKNRQFTLDGLPLCAAGLPMPLKYTFKERSTLVAHECGRYTCPLRYPQPTGEICPLNHKNWPKGGCTSTFPLSIGARLRYQIDRDSELYKSIYKQRTANERINSQAVEFGIEHPKLRNGPSIANHNTLTYVLINLHALQRIRLRKAERASAT